MPFLFTRPGGARAWEARFAVRVGADLSVSDPYADFAAMRRVLAHHQIRVHSARSYWHGVAHRIGRPELVLTIDSPMVFRIRSDIPALLSSDFVALADAELLHTIVGLSRRDILDAVFAPSWVDPGDARSVPSNTLALCARIGALLADPNVGDAVGFSGFFDAVLAGYPWFVS